MIPIYFFKKGKQVNVTTEPPVSNVNTGVMNIDSMRFYGDSITYGMSADGGLDYASKISQYFNVTKNNSAISGTTLVNSYPNNFRESCYGSVPNKGVLKEFLLIAYGTNDGRSEHPYSTPPNHTPAMFFSQYQESIDIILAKGWLVSEIILLTPFYVPDVDLATYSTDRAHYEVYVQNVKDTATANGIVYFDVYTYMKNNGGNSLISGDNVHPTNAGHELIFQGLKAVLNSIIKIKV